MANLIIIRLHPNAPVAGTDFTTYLEGLEIKAYDLSYAHPKPDPTTATLIGTATFLDQADANFSDITKNQIQQHASLVILPPAQLVSVDVGGSVPEAVATAMIVVNEPAGYTEYVGPDLLLQISRAGVTITETTLYYDVLVSTAAIPPFSQDILLLGGPTALYLPIPSPANSSLFTLPSDGSAPNFTALKTAVDAVLAADPAGVLPDLATLTTGQCSNIAYEIIYGPQDPLPGLPNATLPNQFTGALEEMYTDPPNDGSTSNALEQNRQQFEGSLSSYYSTHSASAQSLTKFVVALAAAAANSEQSKAATSALLQFPVNPGAATLLATVSEAEIDITGMPAGTLAVPADYFYALGATLPTQMTAAQRFAMATGDNSTRLIAALQAGLDAGTIGPIATLPINPAQAARRLAALVAAPSGTTICPVTPSIQGVVNDWLAYTGDDASIVTTFWKPEATAAATEGAFLDLVLAALTQSYVISGTATTLASKIKTDLRRSTGPGAPPPQPIASASDLALATPGDWTTFFVNSPGWPANLSYLPPFTVPGTPMVRVNTFIRYVQKFFDLSLTATPLPGVNIDVAPNLPLPTNDPIAAWVAAYELLTAPGFTFGAGPLNQANVQQAAQAVFAGDTEAQAWLVQRINVLNDLCQISAVVSNVPPPAPPSLPFSIAEALYARGYTSIADVNAVSLGDFQNSLRGTVAYDNASAIYAAAGAVGPQPPPTPGPFQPVNPGALINCIPPCYLSPLGPVEYLHELLQLSEASTCKDPFATPEKGAETLGQAMTARRGPLGNLHATAANLDTPLPLIDIVNENLESLVVTIPASTTGVVYDTAEDELDDFELCQAECANSTEEHEEDCYKPAEIFATLPQYSAPATPVAQPGAYSNLASDFSSPCLPYSEPLDICRTYLEFLGTCRFETMRTFRKEITEFALDPTVTAPDFQTHLWRLPVRIEMAVEYLGFTPEEYAFLFTKDIVNVPTPGQILLANLYGFDINALQGWTRIATELPEFLKRLGLRYCELVELQQAGFVTFVATLEGDDIGAFPRCEPCCLSRYGIRFVNPQDPLLALKQLAVFVRLWRKLQSVCGARYTFTELTDLCTFFQLFIGGVVNPDFLRQLAAFQMLRDYFRLRLTSDSVAPGATGADRMQLLSLWVGPGAARWKWAVAELLDHVQHYAKKRHECKPRPAEFIKLLTTNLDPLSRLAGFNPGVATDTWNAKPTHTLRFAEVLAKIYASRFGVGELLYLFTADDHLDGDDPFPLQAVNEAVDLPLDLPDDEKKHSLWELRRKLLQAEVCDEESDEWSWGRIEKVLRHEFGYSVPAGGTDRLLSFGQHFFPEHLESHGVPVTAMECQYRVPLAGGNAAMWNTPPDGPFRYDGAASMLWTHIPLHDSAVIEKLIHLRQLSPAEIAAVQNLYFAPRADLAPFSCLFPNFGAAEKLLIQEPHEEKRWRSFQRHFALTYKRCHLIAKHLAHHVAAVTGEDEETCVHEAWFLLQNLFADGNVAQTPWENDDGQPPNLMTWQPPPSGGAFAALLGLTGTGLLGEYSALAGTVAWREVRGPMSAFGREADAHNCPVLTLLPAMDLTLTPEQLHYVGIRNGFAIDDAHGDILGGAEGFSVRWSGVLLVDEDGEYEFCGGAPTREGEEPNFERAEHREWIVRLSRGQKTWVVLSHHWPGEHQELCSKLHLKRGAYSISLEFTQPTSDFDSADDVCPQRTGFQVKYRGPDTGHRLMALPMDRLYRDTADKTLDDGIQFPENSEAQKCLQLQYSSSLRDIRRTYQRAFKALFFARRLGLSAKPIAPFRESELGYMLKHPDLFAGVSFYRNPAFTRHAAYLNFNFLPLLDNYEPPLPVVDDRVAPSLERIQAMFDWWERLFDYTRMRKHTREERERHIWLLFEEAAENQPDNPAQILRHMDVDLRHADLVLNYFQGQAMPVYAVTASDLEDDRWALRVWHAEKWVRHLLCCFAAKNIAAAKPDLWASDDPSAILPVQIYPGDENLAYFVDRGCLDNGEPPRYEDLERLNTGLRERARKALLAYLCALNRVPLPWTTPPTAQSPKDLSALLLLDVEAGICEKASRIEEAITAVQNFIRRARLGLEPSWLITTAFVQLWEREFATFKIWEACKRRQLYKENWIDWDELQKSKKIEAFQFLESELRRCTLTMPVPGGLEYWPDQLPPSHPALVFLQKRDPSALQLLDPAREGLGVMGTPEWDARPNWLAPLASENDPRPNPPGNQNPAPANPNQPPVGAPRIAASAPQPLAAAPPPATPNPLPFWIESAIRLGVRFYRIAAGGVPPASEPFLPVDFHAEPGCCTECRCKHSPLVDEYYFWLVDSTEYVGDVGVPSPASYAIEPNPQDPAYDQTASGPTSQTSTTWHDPEKLPTMLAWNPEPAVRLAWCRAHNGEFQQPRRSTDNVVVSQGSSPDLKCLGRVGDSLTFEVISGLSPQGYNGTELPGFRFDLASDEAVVLPLVADITPPPPNPNPAGLPAYPYFIYVNPGASLFPLSIFSPAIAVSNVLRAHCRFEPALKWLELVFNPLQEDNTWMHCGQDVAPPPAPPDQPPGNQPGPNQPAPGQPPVNVAVRHGVNLPPAGDVPPGGVNIEVPPDPCCDSTKIPDYIARERAILLLFVETLLEWSHATKRRSNPEAFQQTRLLLDTAASILGARPAAIMNSVAPNTPLQTVGAFVAQFPPLNPRLMALYCHVYDELALIHHCNNSRRLRNGRPGKDMPYWGEDACQRDWRGFEECCSEEFEWCYPPSPYRFLYRVQKAKEIVAHVRELGGALLSAFEKGDAEYLASMRAVHETQLMELTLRVKKNQWRDADWQVQALGLTKQVNQTNRRYYAALIQNGLINNENQYENNTESALAARTVSTVTEAIGEFMQLIPDLFVGFPCEETWLPLGTKLSGMFQSIARISNDLAEIYGSTAGLNLTEAGWDRRLQDWVHQGEDLDIEIEQMEIQILGAERRRDQALQEINIQQLQIEQSHEALDFLRDKFTSHELYLFLQKETAALYYKTYELATHACLQAEQAFNFERGHTHKKFVPCEPWENLHQGLLAGERLDLALTHMEKEFLDLNKREYELTKNISLRLHFPMQYLRLILTGQCEIEIPEWMYDLDYPGHYMRRIKNVSLTLPCVTGPYTGVHCKLTLLSSQTRLDPCLTQAPACCCKAQSPDRCRCHPRKNMGYEASAQDPRIFRQYAAREAIATSTGQSDTGMFQLNFNEDRYLPFELLGAACRLRFELPIENNFFSFHKLADVMLQVNYTSREGGDVLRRAAKEAARCKLPGDGWAFLDLGHEFPDAWELFRRSCKGHKSGRELTIRLSRKLFPFLPCDPEIRVTKLALMFETEEMLEHECPEIEACPCPEEKTCASCVVKFTNHPDDDDCGCGERRLTCYSSEEWPKFYRGSIEAGLLPFHRERSVRPITFCFPEKCGEVVRAYLFCRYEVVAECCEALERDERRSREPEIWAEASD